MDSMFNFGTLLDDILSSVTVHKNPKGSYRFPSLIFSCYICHICSEASQNIENL